MQALGPRQSDQGTVYSADDVLATLTKGVAKERWIWDQLDQTGLIVGDLTPFVEIDQAPPTITYDSTQAVKRNLTMQLSGNVPLYKNGILSLNSQVRGHYQIRMPDKGYIDFVIGTFVVLPAGGTITTARTTHNLVAADYGQLLLDYNFDVATSISGGISAIAAVGALLAIPGTLTPITMVIPDIGRQLVLPITWDAGTSRLKAINDVLVAVNYFPAWFDEMGVLRSAPIPDWNTVDPVVVFDGTRSGSILQVPISLTADWSSVGNIQTVQVEDSRRPAFSVTYVNDNPLSPVSTVNFHRKSLPPHKDSNIPDKITAGLVAKALTQAAARIYQTWTPDTFAWPVSQDQDVIEVVYTDPDDGERRIDFLELGWSMVCKAGQKTNHTLSQLVPA
jgi:hypothetical protein